MTVIEFVEDVFVGAKQDLGLHTALDTSGMGGLRASDRLLDHVDLVLLDIKAGTPRQYAYVTQTGTFDALPSVLVTTDDQHRRRGWNYAVDLTDNNS